MRLTKKQTIILAIVCEGLKDENGSRIGWLDAQEICDRAPYEVSIHSMKFVIRALVKHGMAEKCEDILRRDRWVVPVKPTNLAFDYAMRKADQREIENDNGVVELYL
jgi:hypothetical protein